MKSVCPHCGRLIEEGEQAFDLTPYLGSQVKRYLNSEEFNKGCGGYLDKKNTLLQGMERLFNNFADNNPLIFKEKELWNMTSEKPDMATVKRTVLMKFPYDEIKKRIGITQENDEKYSEVNEWYLSNKSFMSKLVLRLNLIKMGNGDICFDTITDAYNNTVVVRERICPHEGCHGKLSFWSGRYKEICLSVLGGQRVSKTTTLTAMADVFLKGHQGVTWEGSRSDEAYKEFEDTCLNSYRKGKPIPPTAVIKNNTPRISFRVKLGTTGYIVLTFVDLPGELNNENGLSDELFEKYHHYFDNVDFMWYCTDPAELCRLEQAAHQGNLADQHGYGEGKTALRTEVICNNMNQLAGFFNRADKVIPVAYILGKTDSALIPQNEKIAYHLYGLGKKSVVEEIPMNLKLFYEEADLIRQYMHDKNPILVDTFTRNFKEKCFFAMSAYGWNPKETENDRRPDAYKCTVPFIWMLACEGLIPICIQIQNHGGYEKKYIWKRECNEVYWNLILYNLYMKGNYQPL